MPEGTARRRLNREIVQNAPVRFDKIYQGVARVELRLASGRAGPTSRGQAKLRFAAAASAQIFPYPTNIKKASAPPHEAERPRPQEYFPQANANRLSSTSLRRLINAYRILPNAVLMLTPVCWAISLKLRSK